jgi:hypothetical protein
VAELAIVAPVFVAIILWSFYFHDLVTTKLKLQEAARFVTWEFTVFPLQDYKQPVDAGRDAVKAANDALYAAAKGKVIADADRIYRHLDSAYTGGNGPSSPWSTRTWQGVTKIDNDDAGIFDAAGAAAQMDSLFNQLGFGGSGVGGEIVGKVLNLLNQGAEAYFGSWLGFDMKGYIKVDVQAQAKSVYMPKAFLQEFHNNKLLEAAAAQVTLKEHAALIVDTWRLEDGRDTQLPGHYDVTPDSDPAGARTQLRNGVDRLMWGGLYAELESLPIIQQISQFVERFFGSVKGLNNLDPMWMLKGKVVSKGYLEAQDTSCPGGGDKVCQDFWQKPNYYIDSSEGIHRFHTIPYRTGNAYKDSEYYRTHRQFGRHMAHCKAAKMLPGGCQWPDNN